MAKLLQIELPDHTVGFHAVTLDGDNWTMSASVNVPDGDSFVITIEDADFLTAQVALSDAIANHD